MEPLIYERIAAIERAHWWYRGRREIIARLLAPAEFAPSGRAVLSAGCGTGGELRFLSGYGRVFGVDPSESAISHARAAGFGDAIQQASLEAVPFPDGFFRLAFALDVLEHVPREGQALGELFRVLAPGGLAVLTVPAFPELWSRADERAHHLRRYRKRELVRALTAAGFRPLRVTYFNTLLFFPVAGAKLLSRFIEPAFLAGAEVSMPPRWLNNMLARIFSLEAPLLTRGDFPFGVSLLAIAEKPA